MSFLSSWIRCNSDFCNQIRNKEGELVANEQYLIPVTKRTPSEQRAISSKGGKASAKAKKERKALREELLLLLAEGDTQKKVSLALIKRALIGDTKAFEVIRDTIGEKPVEQVQNLNPPVIKLERPNK